MQSGLATQQTLLWCCPWAFSTAADAAPKHQHCTFVFVVMMCTGTGHANQGVWLPHHVQAVERHLHCCALQAEVTQACSSCSTSPIQQHAPYGSSLESAIDQYPVHCTLFAALSPPSWLEQVEQGCAETCHWQAAERAPEQCAVHGSRKINNCNIQISGSGSRAVRTQLREHFVIGGSNGHACDSRPSGSTVPENILKWITAEDELASQALHAVLGTQLLNQDSQSNCRGLCTVHLTDLGSALASIETSCQRTPNQ